MKKLQTIGMLVLAVFLQVTFSGLMMASVGNGTAAPKLSGTRKIIHYWDFNHAIPFANYSNGAKVGSPNTSMDSLGTSTLPLYPSWSNLDSANGFTYDATTGANLPNATGAVVRYYRPFGPQAPALIRDSIIDSGSPGSTNWFDYTNPLFHKNDTLGSTWPAAAQGSTGSTKNYNMFIRTRNPVVGASMVISAPTTKFKNIHFGMAMTGSSVSMANFLYIQYSTDGGNTWNKLTSAMDTFNMNAWNGKNGYAASAGLGGSTRSTPDTFFTINSLAASSGWWPVAVDFSTVAAANNNPAFMLKFTAGGPNAAINSGNIRYDNFVFWGDTSNAPIATAMSVHPKPSYVVCQNANGSLSCNAFGTGITYKWQVSTDGGSTWNNVTDGGVYSGSATKVLTFTSIPAGYNNYKYKCVISSTYDAGLTTNVSTLSVLTGANATISAGGSTALCVGSYVALTGSDAMTSYSWSNGYTTQSINAVGGQTYTLTVTGCGSTASSTIATTLKPTPNAAITYTGGQYYCSNSTVPNISVASGQVAYSWSSTAGVTSATYSITPSTTVSGTYKCYVTGTGLNACVATSPVTTITIVPLTSTWTMYQGNKMFLHGNVASNIMVDSVCSGNPLDFYAIPSQLTPTPTYQWQKSTNGSPYTNIAGADTLNYPGYNDQNLVVNNFNAADSNYRYKCVITSPTCLTSITSPVCEGKFSTKCANQDSVIHYWHFNNTLPTNGGGGINLTNIKADYSAVGSASIVYKASMNGVKTVNDTASPAVVDNVNGGDSTLLVQPGFGSYFKSNNGIRFRNPSDSVSYLFYLPTTGYSNIVLNYAIQASSLSGPQTNIFSYSLDSGKTFTQANLPYDTLKTIGLTWTPVSVNLSGINGANNNPKFVFKITTGTPNTSASGNDRYDNITVKGVNFVPVAVSSITSNQPVGGLCSKDTLKFGVSAVGSGSLNYTWSGPATFNAGNAASGNATQFLSGTYTVTVSNGATTTTKTIDIVNALPADLDFNGVVDINDYLVFAPNFGQTCNQCPSDLDNNGIIDINDYLIFAPGFGNSCN